MRRVNVTGTSSSGKTTFARALGERLGVQVIELDALHWEADWTEAPAAAMRERVRAALAGTDGWVVDGNYSVTRDIVWERVDTVVWLDFGLRVILRRFARRTARRIARRKSCGRGPATARPCASTWIRARACCGGSSRPTDGAGANIRG